MEKVWIGLANVAPLKPGEYGFDGAFVNVLSKAIDNKDFISRVENSLQEMGMVLIEIEDIEPFESRSALYHVSDEVRALAITAETSGSVELGRFHSYDAENEN